MPSPCRPQGVQESGPRHLPTPPFGSLESNLPTSFSSGRGEPGRRAEPTSCPLPRGPGARRPARPQLPAAGVPDSVRPGPRPPGDARGPARGVTHFPPPPPSGPRAPSSPTASGLLPGLCKVGAWPRASPKWTPPRRTWPCPLHTWPHQVLGTWDPRRVEEGICRNRLAPSFRRGPPRRHTNTSSDARPLPACSEKVGLRGSNNPFVFPGHIHELLRG